MYLEFFCKTDSEKIKNQDVHDRTGSVYPIPVLTALNRSSKQAHSLSVNLLVTFRDVSC